MHRRRYFALWFGFLFLAALLLPSLAPEAQIRVPNGSKNTAPSFSPSSASFPQPTVDVPANAALDYSGHAWECKRGYRRAGDACVVVQLPANAALDYSGHAWECKRGYWHAGDACVVVQLPANATLDYTGHAWECEQGYRHAGDACVVVYLPANAALDYSGHAWECKQGYRRVGDACVVLQLPANAALDYSGHAWECKRGYRRVRDACEKMTALPKIAMYDSSTMQETRVDPQQQNDAKEAIRQIQEQLQQAGFDPGPMDGILGPRTMKALHSYLATR